MPNVSFTDDQKRCISAISCLHTGPYNLEIVGGWKNPRNWGDGYVFIKVNWMPGLSTGHHNALTKLVLNAHRYSVRISIHPCSNKALEIRAFARTPRTAGGRNTLEHPTLQDLVQRITNLHVSDDIRATL